MKKQFKLFIDDVFYFNVQDWKIKKTKAGHKNMLLTAVETENGPKTCHD